MLVSRELLQKLSNTYQAVGLGHMKSASDLRALLSAPVAQSVDEDSERAKFDAWYRTQGHVLNLGFDKAKGEYVLWEDECAWRAWKARAALAAPVQPNPEHTLFNEIRISDPVSEDGDLPRYIITEAQLQRIRVLEVGAAPVQSEQEPVAYVLHKNGEVDWDQEIVISNTGGDEQDERWEWVPVYRAAPVRAVRMPEGYCIMPRRLNAENGAKALLLGEFKLHVTMECPECRELDDPAEGCEICGGEGEYGQSHMISWNQIKHIYSVAVKGLAMDVTQLNAQPVGPES